MFSSPRSPPASPRPSRSSRGETRQDAAALAPKPDYGHTAELGKVSSQPETCKFELGSVLDGTDVDPQDMAALAEGVGELQKQFLEAHTGALNGPLQALREEATKELKEIKQRRLESGSSVATAVSRDSAGGQGSHQAAPAKQGEESQASELEKELVRVKQTAAERMAASGPVAGAPGELSSG